MKKRILVFALALAVTFSSVDVTAFAVPVDEEVVEDEIIEEQENEELIDEEINDEIVADESGLEEVSDEETLEEIEERYSFEENVLAEEEPELEIVEASEETEAEEYLNSGMTEEQMTEKDKEYAEMGATIPELPERPRPHREREPESVVTSGNYHTYAASPYYNPLLIDGALPDTRNQGKRGTCFIHGAVAASEINLIKNGYEDENVNLSEAHLANCYFDPVTDPLGLTDGDGLRLDYSDDTNITNAINDRGGFENEAVDLLTTWQGLTEESDYPYKQSKDIDLDLNLDTDEAYGYDVYHVQDYYRVSMKNIKDAQLAIEKYGALTTGYCSSEEFYYQGSNYCPYEAWSNHTITVVGWDDDYDKNNFNTILPYDVINERGSVIIKAGTVCRPKNNGAWLIRNSWMEDSSYIPDSDSSNLTNSINPDGEFSYFTYFWMSYEDQSIDKTGVAVIPKPVEETYDNNYQYDGSYILDWFGNARTSKAANVFRAKAGVCGEYIEAVGFYSINTNMDYTINIYTNPTEYNPESGKLVATKTGTTLFEGYQTVELDYPVYVSKGEKYSVVVTYSPKSGTALIPIEFAYNTRMYWGDNSYHYEEHLANINWGESFANIGKGWFDLKEDRTWYENNYDSNYGPGNVKIKAYTNNAYTIPARANEIYLDKYEVETSKGGTAYINAEVYPMDAADGAVAWKSSNVKIAKVNNGLVTGVANGTCKVTAYLLNNPDVYKECTVNVTNNLSNISIECDKAVGKGDTAQLTAIFQPLNSAIQDEVVWESDDSSVIEVNDRGEITVNDFGSATISATAGFVTGYLAFDIKQLSRPKTRMYMPDLTNRITCSWTPVSDATGYDCSYREVGTRYWTQVPGSPISDTSFDIPSDFVTNGKTYEFSVRAIHSTKNQSSDLVNTRLVVYPGHRINYVLNADDAINTNPDVYRENQAITLNDPVRTGYDFMGWYKTPDFNARNKVTVVSGKTDFTLYAKWQPKKFTIHLDSNGGYPIADKVVEYDEMVSQLPKAYSGTGIFEGWFTDPVGGTRVADVFGIVTFANFMPYTLLSDQTVYAHYSIKYTTDTPQFENVDGTIDNVSVGDRIRIFTDTPGANIYYSTDAGLASNPSSYIDDEHLYDEAYIATAPGTVTLYAFATKPGYYDSSVSSQTFTITGDDFGDVILEDQPASGLLSDLPKNLWMRGSGLCGDTTDIYYNGAAITIDDLRVYYYNKLLKEGTDYTVAYAKNKTAGTATLTVTGKGNYSGKITETFEIKPLDIASAYYEDITVAWTGRVQKVAPKLYYDVTMPSGEVKTITLKARTDYTVDYPGTNSKSPSYDADAFVAEGSHYIDITGNGNFANTASVEEVITRKKLISKMTIDKIPNQPYSGSPIMASPVIKDAKKNVLEYGIDYSLSWPCSDYENVGTVYVVVEGMGEYAGAVSIPYNIVGTAISKCKIEYDKQVEYTGGEVEVGSLVVYEPASRANPDRYDLVEDTDYVVVYDGVTNVNVGKKAVISIKGIGKYTGVVNKTFEITPYSLGDTNVTVELASGEDTKTYTKDGAKAKVEVTFVDDKGVVRELEPNVDYTLTYKNNKNIISDGIPTGAKGEKIPTVIVTGKGNFKNSEQIMYAIEEADIANAEISVQDVVYKNATKNCKPVIKILDEEGKALAAGTDYCKDIEYYYEKDTVVTHKVGKTVEYERKPGYSDAMDKNDARVCDSDIIPAGAEIRVLVNGINKFYGNTTAVFRMISGSVASANVTVAPQFYTGRRVQPSKDDLVVKIGNVVLDKTDYEIVGYKNNVYAGKSAAVIIRGLKNYGGEKTVNFTISAKSMLHTVKYDKNCPSATGAMKDSSIAYGGKLTKNSFKNPGLTFAGWSTDPDATEPEYLDAGVLTAPADREYGKTIVLYAIWR